MSVHLSIIIATVGRPTLLTALASLEPQMKEGDEILVIPDFPRHGGWGYAAHNKGARLASGTHLMWIGDDDDFLPGGLGDVRHEVTAAPQMVHIFTVLKPGGKMPNAIPANPLDFSSELVPQGGIVVPRGVVPVWSPVNSADRDFAAQAAANSNLTPIWHSVPIGRWRTHTWPDWKPITAQPSFNAFDQMHTYFKGV